MKTVERYVITIVTGGQRQLYGLRRGRFTYLVPELAQTALVILVSNPLTVQNIRTLFGPDAPESMEIRPCPCCPITNDPLQTIF